MPAYLEVATRLHPSKQSAVADCPGNSLHQFFLDSLMTSLSKSFQANREFESSLQSSHILLLGTFLNHIRAWNFKFTMYTKTSYSYLLIYISLTQSLTNSLTPYMVQDPRWMVNTRVPIVVSLNMAALSENNPVSARTFRDTWYAQIQDKRYILNWFRRSSNCKISWGPPINSFIYVPTHETIRPSLTNSSTHLFVPDIHINWFTLLRIMGSRPCLLPCIQNKTRL